MDNPIIDKNQIRHWVVLVVIVLLITLTMTPGYDQRINKIKRVEQHVILPKDKETLSAENPYTLHFTNVRSNKTPNGPVIIGSYQSSFSDFFQIAKMHDARLLLYSPGNFKNKIVAEFDGTRIIKTRPLKDHSENARMVTSDVPPAFRLTALDYLHNHHLDGAFELMLTLPQSIENKLQNSIKKLVLEQYPGIKWSSISQINIKYLLNENSQISVELDSFIVANKQYQVRGSIFIF